GWAYSVPRNLHGERRPLHRGQRLTGHESQLGIEGKRAVVIGSLYQPPPREAPLDNPLKDIVHQLAADRAILHRRIDSDRADAGDSRTLVNKVTAYDPAVEFGDHPINIGVC